MLDINFDKIVEKTKANKHASDLAINLESDSQDFDDFGTDNLKSIALNLEDLDEISKLEDLFKLEEMDIDRVIAALGVGFATESVINSRILKKVQESVDLDSDGEYVINESKAVVKTVVRKGKLTKKTVCPDGFMVKGGRCQRMTSKDTIAFTRRAKKAAKTRMRRKPSAASKRTRDRSMLVRSKNKSRVERVTRA